MSEYGGYGVPGEGLRGGSGVQAGPRYGYATDMPQVLASVPDMEAETAGLVERSPQTSRTRRSRDLPSPRLMAIVGAVMLLAGAFGFTLGRAGRSDPSPGTEAWVPAPPAADAPEAPVWPGGEVVRSPSQPLIPGSMPTAADALVRGFAPAPALSGVESRPQGGLVPLAPSQGYASEPLPGQQSSVAAQGWNDPAWNRGARAEIATPSPGGAASPYPPTNPSSTYSPYPTAPTVAGAPVQGPVNDADRFTNPYARALANGEIGAPAVADYSGMPPSNYAGANQSMSLAPAGSQGQGYGPVAGDPEGYGLPNDPRVALRPTQDPIPVPSPPPGVSNDYYRGAPSGGNTYPSARGHDGQPYAPGSTYRGAAYPPNSSGTSPAVVHPAAPAAWSGPSAAGGYASPSVPGNPPAYAAPGAPSAYGAPRDATPYYPGY
ncbi:MAG: hypothetical protein JW809_16960 [Pirellulales bacterium]|nr:hypothetical protein [Pirellulales bacterium]